MSRVSKMSLKEILKEVYLLLRDGNDIIHFCDNMQVIEKYIEKFGDSKGNKKDIEEFLIKNEEHIDKEKFILLMVLNYRENIKILEYRIDALEKQHYKLDPNVFVRETSKYRIQLKEQGKNYETAKRLSKGLNKVLTFYYYDDKEGRYRIDVADSKELLEGIRTNNTKAQKRFDEIDSNFKENETDELGLEYVLQSILLTDFSNIFPDEQFGNYIRTMILENAVLKTGISSEKLEELRSTEYDSKYRRLIEEVKFEKLLPSIKETLREYAQYVDMDKLLLISAYRFELGLESLYIEPEKCLSVKEIFQGILESIKTNNAEINCILQKDKENSKEIEEISYSVKDIKRCISQFTKDSFLTTKQIEEYREKIYNRQLNLTDMDSEYIDIIFSTRDLETISKLSIENLMYVCRKNNWDISRIIQLYYLKEITLGDITVIKEQIDLSNSISFEDIILYYKQIQEDTDNQEFIEKYINSINLYKELFVNNKEELETSSNNIMLQIIENFEGKEYNEAIKEFYKQGVISLNSVSEWSNESLLIELFEEGLINLQQVTRLVKEEKLSPEYLHKIYFNLINDKDIEYEERLKLIKDRFVTEEVIFDLYRRNLIFEKDLTNLSEDGIVRKDEAKRIISSRTMRELERNSAIRLTGLNSLTKKNSDIYSYGGIAIGPSKSTNQERKLIIDPNERERFIRMLRAYRANTDLSSDSPFYNYEFYVIPDESGTIGLNSVVIAERYYEDKDTETRFAMNNATYFFKYKDLMVLSNLRKSEMTKERENIVFTANHVIANEKREGRWATSVISSIAKTMLSSDLKDYKKENQRAIIQQKLREVYTAQELITILEMASNIDLGEYICEIEEPTTSSRRKSNKIVKMISDDDAR